MPLKLIYQSICLLHFIIPSLWTLLFSLLALWILSLTSLLSPHLWIKFFTFLSFNFVCISPFFVCSLLLQAFQSSSFPCTRHCLSFSPFVTTTSLSSSFSEIPYSSSFLRVRLSFCLLFIVYLKFVVFSLCCKPLNFPLFLVCFSFVFPSLYNPICHIFLVFAGIK